jgi:hypothetical protein
MKHSYNLPPLIIAGIRQPFLGIIHELCTTYVESFTAEPGLRSPYRGKMKDSTTY